MKRITQSGTSLAPSVMALVLCTLYLLFSVGIVKATHFCMGREASVSYFTAESDKCACSLFAAEKDRCCDDKQDLVKLEDSQKTLTSFQLSSPALLLLGQLYLALPLSELRHATLFSSYPAEAQPPPKDLFEFYCSFVFYDKKMLA